MVKKSQVFAYIIIADRALAALLQPSVDTIRVKTVKTVQKGGLIVILKPHETYHTVLLGTVIIM